MGVSCCQEAQDNTQLLTSTIPPKSDFVQSEWPNQTEIKEYLKEVQKENQKPLKHRHNQYYYLGEWANAKPSGQGIIYIPGKIIYHGRIQDGRPNGHGKVHLIECQSMYSGNFTNGQANGQGYFENTRQNYIFQGQWLGSRPLRGNLKFINNKTVIHFSDYAKSIASIVYHDGKKYTGQIDSKTLLPSGVGQVQFPDRSTYSGEWSQGKMHGKGIFEWRNPQDNTVIEKYDGDYIFGKKHGYGTFYFTSGNLYEGAWGDGKMNGKGRLTDINGKEIQYGVWINGQFSSSIDQAKQILLEKGKQYLNSYQPQNNHDQIIKNNHQQHLGFPTVSPNKNQNQNYKTYVESHLNHNQNHNQQRQTANNHDHKVQWINVQHKKNNQTKNVDNNGHHVKHQ